MLLKILHLPESALQDMMDSEMFQLPQELLQSNKDRSANKTYFCPILRPWGREDASLEILTNCTIQLHSTIHNHPELDILNSSMDIQVQYMQSISVVNGICTFKLMLFFAKHHKGG